MKCAEDGSVEDATELIKQYFASEKVCTCRGSVRLNECFVMTIVLFDMCT